MAKFNGTKIKDFYIRNLEGVKEDKLSKQEMMAKLK